ncbi:MAG: 2,5-diamino-6-(ribosylamino)-4(3H)-pyrimidinone 5'-phosphate reductase [Candidatus Thermoplasmatota archaeon]|nr:2,5-diamino-6-(ribosylamino)-4(3H)-pyrimidinone 5'-phosphate reductase [Candidatus Thermoplasmatota archaeon]
MRPYVIINCAMSVDGKIALPTGVQTKISNEKDMQRVHRLRNSCDAILVGIGTILADDPKLTVKKEYIQGIVRSPIRVVIDSKCRIPRNAKVLNGTAKTIIAVAEGCSKELKNAEVIKCGKGEVDLRKLLITLRKIGIRKLLVEGGSKIIWSFLSNGLADELNVFVGSIAIGGETTPTLAGGEGAKKLESVVKLKLKKVSKLDNGVLLQYIVK